VGRPVCTFSKLRSRDRVGDGEKLGIVAEQLEHLLIEPQLWLA